MATRTVDGGLVTGGTTDLLGLSGTGQYVLFTTTAPLILPTVNATTPPRLYLRNVITGQVEAPTRLDGGLDVTFVGGDVSASGREIAFMSALDDLATGDTNNGFDGFALNLDTNQREILTRTSAGAQVANGEGFPIWLFGDARYALFWSRSNYELAGGEFRPYQRDRVTGTTVDLSREGQAYNGGGCTNGFSGSNSVGLDLSPSYTQALWETAANYPGVDSNNCNDVHWRHLLTGARAVVSSQSDGGLATPVFNKFSSAGLFLSDTRVLFQSDHPLVVPDTNNGSDLFVKDLTNGQLTRLDVALDGGQPNGTFTYSAHTLSGDRRYFVFVSSASNLVADDTNGKKDCFEYDFLTRRARRINLQSDGGQASADCASVHISADGRFAAFSTTAPLLPDDVNGVIDVYVQRLR